MKKKTDPTPKQKDAANIRKPRRVNKTTDTQLESWGRYKESGGEWTHNQRVLEYLSGREANSRLIANALRIERSAVTKALNTLWSDGTIRVAAVRPCPITGRKTQFYTPSGHPNKPEGVPAPTISGEQIDLFVVLIDCGR